LGPEGLGILTFLIPIEAPFSRFTGEGAPRGEGSLDGDQKGEDTSGPERASIKMRKVTIHLLKDSLITLQPSPLNIIFP
jgi:hypothetical protein